MKNYVYVAVAIDDRGWDDESLWGCSSSEEDRIFATASEAWEFVHSVRDAECWEGDIPVLTVERHTVYEWLWGEYRHAITDRVVELHGGTIRLDDMPPAVGRFLVKVFSGAGRGWARASADLRGASSATHTAALVSGAWHSRAEEVKKLFAARGIDIA